MSDPIDHPFISLLIVTFVVFGVFFGLGAMVYYACGYDNPYNYKYTDLDGNEGYAQWCDHEKNLNCYTDNGYVQVKEFHKND